MKAVIDGKEIELVKIADQFVPAEGEFSVESLSPHSLLVLANGASFTTTLLSFDKAEKELEILIDGKKVKVKVKEPLDDLLHTMGMDLTAKAGVSSIKAPMPGMVLDVAVKPGSAVSKGDKILVLEAMKMENVIKSSGDGIVARVLVDKGQTVDKNQILVEFE